MNAIAAGCIGAQPAANVITTTESEEIKAPALESGHPSTIDNPWPETRLRTTSWWLHYGDHGWTH